MTNYFTHINTRSKLKTQEPWDTEDARKDLLYDHYMKKRDQDMTPKMVERIDDMYEKWCLLLFTGFNIIVRGSQSKYSLLETFRERYLNEPIIPDLSQIRNSDDSVKTVKVVTVRMHGLDEELPLITFLHGLFNITDKESTKKIPERVKSFARHLKRHHVFLIHSLDSFLKQKDGEEIFSIIMQLHKINSEYVHIVASTDSINSGKKINNFKYSLSLIFFIAPYTESFWIENYLKGRSALGADELPLQQLYDDTAKINLESLKSVYEALGGARKIMVFIIENFIEKSENKHPTDMDYAFLVRFCQNSFIARRAVVIRGHLDELCDHHIVTMKDGNMIHCLIELKTCKKFLEYLKTRPQDE